MITKDRMFELLLAADPTFLSQWNQFLKDYKDEADKPLYLALGELAQHVIRRLEKGHTDRLEEVFAVVEKWHTGGDSYVSEAATVGFLESLQNWLGGDRPSRLQRERLQQIEGYLGPESRRWWKKLYGFWGGDSRALRSDT